MTFGDMLLERRKELGLSLRDAAGAMNISHTYLSALEKGMDPRTRKPIIPSQQVIKKICDMYGMDLSKVLAYFSIYEEQDMFIYMGHQLNALRKTNPQRFREVLEIIYSD